MRRKDREIKTREEIYEVMKKCQVCYLAMNDGEYPYILPMNFGFETNENVVIIYFHGGMCGKKYEVLEKNNKVSFAMECETRLVTDVEKGTCVMEYESVVGNGEVQFLEGEEKRRAFHCIVEQYHSGGAFEYNEALVSVTRAFKVTVKEISGRRRIKR